MAEKGSQEAASLLRLPPKEISLNDPEELHNVPPDVLQAYSEAEQAMNEPNRSGLQQAIGKYQHALELDPHFALGYAKLAKAYIDQYLVTHEPANIDLAERNASNALLYNPNSAMGLLSQGLVFSYSGKAGDASVSRADPPKTLRISGSSQAFGLSTPARKHPRNPLRKRLLRRRGQARRPQKPLSLFQPPRNRRRPLHRLLPLLLSPYLPIPRLPRRRFPGRSTAKSRCDYMVQTRSEKR